MGEMPQLQRYAVREGFGSRLVRVPGMRISYEAVSDSANESDI